jgi:hypothetical protein
MNFLLELSSSQTRQYIDAETVFSEWRRVCDQATQVRGGLFWREQNAKRYLIRTNAAGGQKSLGPECIETQQIFERFQTRKHAFESRLASLKTALSEQQRLNKALRVGRVPPIVINVLNALHFHGLQDHFLTVGTHALYAYESACGVRFMPQAMATQDIDLLFDTRKRLAFASKMQRLDRSLIGALQKADASFKVKWDKKQTAINASGFEIDIIRRDAKNQDPHPLRMSEHEDDFWAAQIGSGEQILGAQRFSQMVISTTGHMALMHTMHPLTFIAVKQKIAGATEREALKRRKDALQAQAVQNLVDSYMPQYAKL